MADEKITNLRNASQNLSGHRRVLEGILALMAAGEELGSVEQVIRDLEGRKNVAARDSEQAKERLHDLEAKQDKAKKAIAEAEATAKKTVDAATARAVEINRLAKEEGARLTGLAAGRKSAIEGEVAEARKNLDELNRALEIRRGELAEIEIKIADTKAEALKRFA